MSTETPWADPDHDVLGDLIALSGGQASPQDSQDAPDYERGECPVCGSEGNKYELCDECDEEYC